MAEIKAKAEVVGAVFGDVAEFAAEIAKQRDDIEYGRMLLREAEARVESKRSELKGSSDDG